MSISKLKNVKVKNLLNNYVSDDVILKSTNISHEELEKLKKELK